jgi:hypothetical protein
MGKATFGKNGLTEGSGSDFDESTVTIRGETTMTFDQAEQLAALLGGVAMPSLPDYGLPGVELTRSDGIRVSLHENGGAAYQGDKQLYRHQWRTWHGSDTWAKAVACLLGGIAVPRGYVYEVWFIRADGVSVELRAKEVWAR